MFTVAIFNSLKKFFKESPKIPPIDKKLLIYGSSKLCTETPRNHQKEGTLM